ncbi:hypothetical protein BDZ94DRAFT_1249613 [Collybia nuda]|uniref:Uncharacterized protein n=1 Tax=Collybia nuda TaxID=64659 RepID=A0A9P5YD79_9AGAR|nr:hypothetical protein BDZ94DRAFT_1249613 [Collybia nuda]
MEDPDLAGKTITIRQIRNPYVPEIESIAYSKVTLDHRGWLDLQNLGVGIGVPGKPCWIVMRPGEPDGGGLWGGLSGYLCHAKLVKRALAGGDVITVIDPSDADDAWRKTFNIRKPENEKSWAGTFKTMFAPLGMMLGAPFAGPTTQKPTKPGRESSSAPGLPHRYWDGAPEKEE